MDNDLVDTQTWTVTNTGIAVGNATTTTVACNTTGCWDYWQQYPTPYYLNMSYPVYVDKGRQAFEVVKKLTEAKLLELRTAKQFMDAMDVVLKSL